MDPSSDPVKAITFIGKEDDFKRYPLEASDFAL